MRAAFLGFPFLISLSSLGTWRHAGLVFINPCGLRLHFVSVNNRCNELASIKVADGSGNSLVVSGVVTYRVIDSARAALDMEHMEKYVQVQAHAVLKRVASRFPYVTYDGSPSLITEQAALGIQLQQLLQDKVTIAGVHIVSYELSDLAYAKEIGASRWFRSTDAHDSVLAASQMLVRQQAQAVIDARKTIVAGAVGIVADAMEGLKDRGLDAGTNEADKNRIVANLMVVLCGEQKPMPTFDM